MSTETHCPRCRSPLGDGTLAGQCPRCLAALAFGEPDPDTAPTENLRARDFEFLRELGRGGIGIVYEAHQRSLNRRVAVKMLLTGAASQPRLAPRFRAEAEAAARLRHPGIVTIHEVGELDGHPYLAMEFLPGPSLADLVRTQPLGPSRAARYLRLVAEAIEHAHHQGVLHRDLKPSNVLLDAADMPRVTDFGLAKLVDAEVELTRTADLAGSPNFVPPEAVVGGRPGPAGDIYSLGALLYQLLTTRPPFVGETVAATLQQVLHADPIPPRRLNAAVPADLETLCLKCLSKDPAARYARAADLAADLARFEGGRPVLARPVSRVERLVRWCRRNPAVSALATALATTAAFGLLSVLVQWRRAEANQASLARNLYAADIAAAATALKEGNLGRARDLLRIHAPGEQEAGPDTTEFTWRFLWARCQGDDLATLGLHPWIVTCVAVSPDGRWVASGSQDQPDDTTRTLQLHALDPQPGSEAPPTPTSRMLAASNTVWSVAFTADSRTLVSAGVGGVRFWDVGTGEPAPRYPARLQGQEIALAGNTLVASPNHPFFDGTSPGPLLQCDLTDGSVRPLPIRGRHPALSPDGRQLAVLDEDRSIRIHDLEGGAAPRLVATNHLVFRLRFSPDGRYLAASGQMTAAKVWDLAEAGLPPRAFRTTHNVWDATFVPDSRTLVVATSHQQLELWDMASLSRIGSLSGHANEVWTVATTPDGRRLVSGGKDRSVRLWDFRPPRAPGRAPHWRHARPDVSPDSSRLLTYSQTNGVGAATVWGLPAADARASGAPPAPLGNLPGYPRGFAPDGEHVLFARPEIPALIWRKAGTNVPTREIPLLDAPHALTWSEFALSGDRRQFACPEAHGGFGRWSTEDGRRSARWADPDVAAGIRAALASAPRPHRLFRSLTLSRSGRWLALGPFGTYAAVLADLDTGRTLRLRGHRDDIAAMAFDSEERQLATGSVDGTIRLWSTADGREIATLPGHLESVEAVAFSPDGRTLASINPGIEVTFWHLPTRRELARWRHPEAGHFAVFAPDGARLVLATTEGNLGTETDRVELWEAPPQPRAPTLAPGGR